MQKTAIGYFWETQRLRKESHSLHTVHTLSPFTPLLETALSAFGCGTILIMAVQFM